MFVMLHAAVSAAAGEEGRRAVREVIPDVFIGSLGPVWRRGSSSSAPLFPAALRPLREAGFDGCTVAWLGFTALFTGRVSAFPGCSDTLQLRDGVAASGSCIYQAD